MQLTEFLSLLENVKSGVKHHRAVVPGSGSKNRNLAVWEEAGWICLRDFSGKATKEDVLKTLGLSVRDLATSDTHERVHTYKRNGRVVARKIIKKLPNGDKVAPRWEGANGEPNLQHLGGKKTLFNQDAIAGAIKRGEPVYLLNGEKAVEILWHEFKRVGVCTPDGENGAWLPEFTEALRGVAEIIEVADRDKTGETAAKNRYLALRKAGFSVSVVSPKPDGEHDDLFDHIVAGYDLSELVPRPELMVRPTFGAHVFDQTFKPVSIQHLWNPYLPAGKCVLFDADGGTGKTSLLAAICASLSLGKTPVTLEPCDPVTCLYFHKGEDQNDEIHSIAHANGCDPSRIRYIDDPNVWLDDSGCEILGNTIEDTGARFVVFDAFFYFISRFTESTGDNLEALEVMQRVNKVAHQTGATFASLRHTTKGTVGKAASELGMGSAQYRNSHRGQLVLRWHPDSKNHPGVVVVVDEKGSLLNMRGEPFAYRRVGLEIQFIRGLGNPYTTPTEVGQKAEVVKSVDVAKELLTELITGKWMLIEEIINEAESRGISKRTLYRAKEDLGTVRSSKLGAKIPKPSHWKIPLDQPDQYDVWEDSE